MFCQSQYYHQTPAKQREPSDLLKKFLHKFLSNNKKIPSYNTKWHNISAASTTSDLLFQNHYLSRTILYTSLLMHLLIQWPEINNTCNRIKKQNKYIMINNKITIGLHVHVQCTCTCSLERTEKKIIILNDHHIIIYHNDDIWSIIYHLKLYYNFL